ncbi:VOC family protein [Curvibacter sp. HBC28]|uniref:VOC family protein n=1 Tax=Curvibacter microcysteis TaxID=3026419 RepID=A0ABT5MAT0_9BURK|nr:VOC family protein [Curvibacter sp. HBC28]MDD0813695.1 VOC family protein [Curvibacter sp. HBC28]
MFSHVFMGVSDFERALAFYQPVLACLGLAQRFVDAERPWAGWHGAGGQRPLFVISTPHDGQPHAAGNGQMVAFAAASRRLVDQAHATALAQGGRCEGPPGLRPQYHAHYYGAYVRDPEGNKIAFACHEPVAE